MFDVVTQSVMISFYLVEISFPPVWSCGPLFLNRGICITSFTCLSFARRHLTSGKSICLWWNNHLGFHGLLVLQLFVCICIYLFGTFSIARCSSHLLSHHLLERAVFSTLSTLSKFKEPFRFVFLILDFNIFFSELVDVRLRQNPCFVRLPSDIIELSKSFRFFEYFRPIRSKNLETIVDLKAFVQNWVHNVSATGWPLDLYRAWKLCFSNRFLSLNVPKVHFALCDIAKTSNH